MPNLAKGDLAKMFCFSDLNNFPPYRSTLPVHKICSNETYFFNWIIFTFIQCLDDCREVAGWKVHKAHDCLTVDSSYVQPHLSLHCLEEKSTLVKVSEGSAFVYCKSK